MSWVQTAEPSPNTSLRRRPAPGAASTASETTPRRRPTISATTRRQPPTLLVPVASPAFGPAAILNYHCFDRARAHKNTGLKTGALRSANVDRSAQPKQTRSSPLRFGLCYVNSCFRELGQLMSGVFFLHPKTCSCSRQPPRPGRVAAQVTSVPYVAIS